MQSKVLFMCFFISLNRVLFPVGIVGIFLIFSLSANAGNTNVRVEYSAFYDSNFSRTEIEQDETIDIAALKIDFAERLSKQRFTSAVQFQQLFYRNDESLDSSYVTGNLNWEGQVGTKILFDASADRDAYAVDPLEYKGKDIISKNKYLTRIGYGSRENVSIWFGGVNIKQTHSAPDREILDFEEPALFVEVIAQSEHGIEHQFAAYQGERSYKTGMNMQGQLIDFDYSKLAYDISWKKNDIHTLSLGVAGFEREGEINDDRGTLANVRWAWKPKSKLSLHFGFVLNQPAAGEEVETPTEVRDTSVGVRWSLSERWQLGSEFLHSEQDYINTTTLEERGEKWHWWRPITIAYTGSRWFSARLETELYERQSSAVYRAYDGTVVNLTLAAKF